LDHDRASDLDPHVLAPYFAPKPMHPFTPDGRATPIRQLEMPAVQWTNHLAFLNPPMPERASGMRTSPGQGNDLDGRPEYCQPQPQRIQRAACPLPELVKPAYRNPLRHTYTPLA
jgi:hypothetical protein